MKPILALTIGDISGICPEIIARAYSSGKIFTYSRPVVIGAEAPLKSASKLIRTPLKVNKIKDIKSAAFRRGEIDLIEVPLAAAKRGMSGVQWGKISVSSARIAIRAIEFAVEMALQGGIQAIVTLPVNKEGLQKAGFIFPGHTEFLAHLTSTKNFAMLLIGGNIRVILVTRHIPLKDVGRFIKREEVLKNIIFAHKGGELFGISSPRIAVAGLNPHAGEGGLLGKEERDEIIPAIRKAVRRGIRVCGPYPSDSLFYRVNKGEFDIVVAMYHDQGLIPLKMISFEESVNVTLGLPIIRTSPGHGTGYDIAGKGIAKEGSLLEAVKLAAIFARNRDA